MGGAVARGVDNDDLVDNLKKEDYITSPDVEKAFRAVDRGDFFLSSDRDSAYEDHAWRSGTLHLSAPCIYSKAAEALDLKDGLSFLNVGSGTGYFSTLVGTIIGPRGTNHGIELHDSNVRYARETVEEWVRTAPHFDRTSFCYPKFVVGNALLMNPTYRGYDRVYVGAACPQEYIDFFKSLLNMGGVLVVPYDNQLQRIERVGKDDYNMKDVLSVSFADLIPPSQEQKKHHVATIEIGSNPITLQDCCRLSILTAVGSSLTEHLEELPLPRSLQPYLQSFRKPDVISNKIAEKRHAAEKLRASMNRPPKRLRKREDEREDGESEDTSEDEDDDGVQMLALRHPLLIRIGQLGGFGIVGNLAGMPSPPSEVQESGSGD